jgi:hypothetical protein
VEPYLGLFLHEDGARSRGARLAPEAGNDAGVTVGLAGRATISAADQNILSITGGTG